MDVDEALDEINVELVDSFENPPPGFSGWFAVTNKTGIIAYFKDEHDACRFRVSEVKRLLNG